MVSIAAVLVLLYLIHNTNLLLGEQKTERAQAQLHQQELSSLERLVQETSDERKELTGYILKNDGVIDFLALIETLGTEQNVQFKTNSLKVVEKDNIFEELQIDILINGPYKSVLHTLALFESLPYQSYISKLTFTRGTGDGSPWNADFLLHVTKFKEK